MVIADVVGWGIIPMVKSRDLGAGVQSLRDERAGFRVLAGLLEHAGLAPGES